MNDAQETDKPDFKQLDGQLNSLQQQWNNAGEVDRNQYKKLQLKFKNAIAPIKSAISVFHASNTAAKQALIVEAQALLENEDVLAAIDSAKLLQQSWREVGFAGNHQENQLWQKFRQVNDELFGKRQQFKSEQQAVLSTQQQLFTDKVIVIETSLNAVTAEDDKQVLHAIEQQAEALLKEVVSSRPVIKPVAARIEKIVKKVAQLIKSKNTAKEQQTWSNLFELMSIHAQNSQDLAALQASTVFNNMSSFWQKRFQEHVKLIKEAQISARFDKTLEIEILGKSDSPVELAEQRLKVQVQLMQEQMQSGTEIDLSKLLVEWLMLGALVESDLPLIERLKTIYC